MDSTKIEDFVASASLLAAHLTRHCDAAATRQHEAARDLGTAASELAERAIRSRDELLRSVDEAVRRSMTAEVDAARRAIGDGADRLQHAATGLGQSQRRLDARMRWLGGGALLAIAAGAITVLGATGHFARQNIERAERARVRADVLEALEQVVITSCDGAPCIKLEAGQRRWPANDEYVLIERPGPGS